MKTILILFLLPLVFLWSCNENKEPQLFELLNPELTKVKFSNIISTNDTVNALNFDYIYNGGGVAIGDINNDGLPDLYFSGNMVSSKLYLNKGNFLFEDITDHAGVGTTDWATGVAMVDINDDQFLDIYVCIASKDSTKSKNIFFLNNGDNTFTEKAKEFGLDDNGYSTQAAFFDYDLDGDLDMYLLTNGYDDYHRNNSRPKLLNGEGVSTDKLYRNNGNGTFSNVSREAGILVEGYGLGVAIADINGDSWPDVYVANDFITNDLMWINNGDGTFHDAAADLVKHQSHNGMGTDVADFNNDGLVDIVVMDMLPNDNLRQKSMFPNINYDKFILNINRAYIPQYVRNTLQLNNGNGTFSEIGQLAGIHDTDWSWSALFSDFDNDGFKDLLVTNGYRKDVTDLDFIVYNAENNMFGSDKSKTNAAIENMDKLKGAHVHNFIFKNTGQLKFNDVSEEWGLADLSYSNGAAFADLDNDGDLDLVINNIDQEAFIYKNNADKLKNNNFLQIKLLGKSPNKAGLGTKIILKHQNSIQYHEHNLYRGYKSTVDDIIHFGTGEASFIDTVIFVWPDGKNQVLTDVKTNQRLKIDYEDALEVPEKLNKDLPFKPIFIERTGNNRIDYKHQEKDYIDFKVQPLVPHKFSQNGPGIAVGDITGNGLEDFYVGGAAGFSGKIYYQVKPEKFEGRDLEVTKPEEDMGSLFFDADNDGDLDLYIVSGGSDYPENSKNYQDRLYINDGKGNFILSNDALPEMFSSGSCITAADYDQDGYLDLFVGGRIVPGKYPLPAKSYILKNNKGKFIDVTAEIAEGLQNIGLVSTALWTDFDNDNKIDLFISGEWMPLTIFKNTGTSFKHITANSGLAKSHGWWNSIVPEDFDGDGDIDYVAGNLGLNSFYKASPDEPVRIYAADFDNNGSIDPILTHYINGKEHPAHPRDNLIDQITSMKGRFPKYSKYGEATIKEVLTKDEINKAYKVKSEYFQSAYIENLGNGKFTIKPLPIEAQFAPVYGMIADDFDGDGLPDLVLSGNSYATETNTGWYDASIGLYLKGDGKGEFYAVPVNESGFFIDKDVKGMAELSMGNGHSLILAASNNDSLKTFQYQSENHKIIRLRPEDAYALITLENGKQIRKEFHYGAAYLSQSSRVLKISKNISSIDIFNFEGTSRSVSLKSDKNIAHKE